MSDKPPRFDGFALAMMGLATLLAMGMVLTGSIRLPATPDDTGVQNSMAWAAWAMVWVSIIGGTIGAASLYLIYRTLLAAQRSAKAAEETADISRDIGMAQARAYLSLESAQLRSESATTYFSVDLLLRNSGQSPSRSLSIQCIVEFTEVATNPGDGEVSEILRAEYSQRQEFHDIAANQTAKCGLAFFTFPGPNSLHKTLQETMYVVFKVTSEVTYQDVFGQEFIERSRFQHAINESDDLTAGIDLVRRNAV